MATLAGLAYSRFPLFLLTQLACNRQLHLVLQVDLERIHRRVGRLVQLHLILSLASICISRSSSSSSSSSSFFFCCHVWRAGMIKAEDCAWK